MSSRIIEYHLPNFYFAGTLNYTYLSIKDEVCELTVMGLREDCQQTEEDVNLLPRYHMTRTITIQEVNIEGVQYLVIKYSCIHFLWYRCPCRQLYCITNKNPDIDHFSPECTLENERFNREVGMEEYTSNCNNIIGTFNCHGGLVLRDITLLEFKKQMKKPQGDIVWYNNALTDLGIDMTPRDKNMATQLAKYKHTNTKLNTRKKPNSGGNLEELWRMANVVKTEVDIKIINNVLIEVRGRIMRKNSRGSEGIRKGMVQEFPAVESRQTETRMAPPGSPGRRKNKH